MRWDRLFDDLEGQLASEWEAERAALDTEAERLRLSRVSLRERLEALRDVAADDTARSGTARTVVDLVDGTSVRGRVGGVGADWVMIEPDEGPGRVLVPLPAVVTVGAEHADILRSARPAASARSALADRLTFGYTVRSLVRRRLEVTVGLATGRSLHGTVDRAGVDHLDLAMHEPGAFRRAGEVTGHRLVGFGAIAWLRVRSGAQSL